MDRTGSFTGCAADMVRWVATLKAMAGGNVRDPKHSSTRGWDRTMNLGIGNLDSNANDAVLQMLVRLMGAKVPVTTASSKSIAQVIPGRQSRVKAANFLEFLPGHFIFLNLCISLKGSKIYCSADGVTHNIARRSWWDSVLLAGTKWVI
jgi:hypothetical protein